MCVAAIAWQAHPGWQLIIAANRDEFHERPAAPLGAWPDNPDVLAGRDLRSGGSWLGVSRSGRAALITNFRVPEGPQPGKPSRGDIVRDWLTDGSLPDDMSRYNPFNLFVAGPDTAEMFGGHQEAMEIVLPPGIRGLSNGAIDRPWPKTRQLCASLSDWLASDHAEPESLFAALRQEAPTQPREWLPDHPEPRLAPVFIRNPVYGTRCSTVIAVRQDGSGIIAERSFAPSGDVCGEARLQFEWPCRVR